MISEICKATGGWFTFVSGNNCLRVYSNNITTCSTYLKGTALGIRIKTNSIKNCQAIINCARTNGETEAKSIKNAFKEASVPSKGLLY